MITVQQISIRETDCIMQWIMIYSVDSVIHLLNNWGLGPGAGFSKVPIIKGPGKLSPFTFKIEVLVVLHLT